jgi:hypothetical protein
MTEGDLELIGSEVIDYEISKTPDKTRRAKVLYLTEYLGDKIKLERSLVNKMNIRNMTNEEIRIAGLAALVKEPGPVGMVRFLQNYETGTGNYTKERHNWLKEGDVESLANEIMKRRNK